MTRRRLALTLLLGVGALVLLALASSWLIVRRIRKLTRTGKW